MAEEDRCALEEDVIKGLCEHFGTLNLPHVKLEPCSDPGQWWIGKLPSIRRSLSRVELLEVFLERQSGQNSSSDCPFEPVQFGLERSGRRSRCRRGHEFTL